MPFYQVFHPTTLFSTEAKLKIVEGITTQHAAVAGAATSAVKIVFVPVAEADSFSNGKPAPFVRVVALIKGGRDAEKRTALLAALTRVFVPFVEQNLVELTLVENRPEDTVRYAGTALPEEAQQWAALAKPVGF